MDAAAAWELTIAGFAGAPYARRVGRRLAAGPLTAVQIAAGEVSGAPFAEYFAHGCEPAEALAALAAAGPPPQHYLTVLAHRPGLRRAYERAGYRLADYEILMALDLAAAPAAPPAWPVQRLPPDADPGRYHAADPEPSRWLFPENLHDPHSDHYVIMDGELVAARGRAMQLGAEQHHVSRVFVGAAWRGQGRARALMLQMIADARARGARWSALTATRMGAPLYRRLGYRRLGVSLIFAPGPRP